MVEGRILADSEHHGMRSAATLERLWWIDSPESTWHSLQWWQIEQAFWNSEEEQLRVLPVDGEPLLLSVSPKSPLPEVVRERVMASIISSVPVEVGAGVQVTFRSSPEGVRVQSQWTKPEQASDPRFQGVFSTALRILAADLGLEISTSTI
jgi:hypothetical protein